MTGKLITFEGIDGCGKSTQAGLVRDWLAVRGVSVELMREPGGTPLGERIRGLLLGHEHADMTAESELFLYLAARSQLTTQVICPALELGTCVLLDRFIDSTTAYQGFARGLGYDRLREMNLFATGGMLPDLTLCFDIDPADGLSRAGEEPDRLEAEGVSFMSRVRAGYHEIARNESGRFTMIDGTGSIESIHSTVRTEIVRRFPDLVPDSS